ncbi:hypothetical protein T439DRAFT_325835 [Meredithblackwellia eburnea MCA 4105]
MPSPTERTPLVNHPAASGPNHPRGKRRASPDSNRSTSLETGQAGNIHLTEDDLCIEAMVLVLLKELVDRGYPVPPGLVEAPPEMSVEEAEAEQAVYRTVFTAVRRHRDVLAEYLPYKNNNNNNNNQQSNQVDPLNLHPPPAGTLPTPLPSARTSSQPSPSSSQVIDPSILTAPSALLLAALLSLLISLQQEFTGLVQETDRGVDGELRMFKARRDLGERLYAVVEGLLDSYLLSGDERDDDGEDALVRLLFHDFPLNYDSMDRATCSLDLLLNLSSQDHVEAENLVSHPVVLASTEYVWRNGLLPPPARGESTTLSWKDTLFRLDRFSIPRILHSQAYILSTLHAAITIYILMFSSYAHFDALNPLAPDKGVKIPERGGHPEKGWSLFTSLVWWLWVAGAVGWAGEVGRAWHHRGPHPSLPLSPSTLLPLIHHLLVISSLAFRFSLLFLRRKPTLILASSITMLAWSVPFLAASRILPQNLPAFGAPTHQRWDKINDGRKRRDVGYRAPPKFVPQSHRALRSLEAHLGGLVQFGTYFAVFGILLLWSLSGELDYPGYFFLPLSFLRSADQEAFATLFVGKGTVSPIEARTTLAFTLVLGVVLAYFAGGRPSVSGKIQTVTDPVSGQKPQRGLDDLDGWARYGREVAFRSRRERLALNRYYSFVPPIPNPREESVPSAYSNPPLTAPLNLFIPVLLVAASLTSWVGREDLSRKINERGRLWAWRFGISPLGLWAILARGYRTVRGYE